MDNLTLSILMKAIGDIENERNRYFDALKYFSTLDDRYPDNDLAMIVAARAREALETGGKIQREGGL